VRSGEYQRASLNALMAQPYGRVVVLHLTVLFGGWVVMLLGSPLFALVLLVVLKTAATGARTVPSGASLRCPDRKPVLEWNMPVLDGR